MIEDKSVLDQIDREIEETTSEAANARSKAKNLKSTVDQHTRANN